MNVLVVEIILVLILIKLITSIIDRVRCRRFRIGRFITLCLDTNIDTACSRLFTIRYPIHFLKRFSRRVNRFILLHEIAHIKQLHLLIPETLTLTTCTPLILIDLEPGITILITLFIYAIVNALSNEICGGIIAGITSYNILIFLI